MEQLSENFIYNFVVEDNQQMANGSSGDRNNQQPIVCFQELWWNFEFLLLCTPKEEVGTLFWREDSF
jgi:hypothetical protein